MSQNPLGFSKPLCAWFRGHYFCPSPVVALPLSWCQPVLVPTVPLSTVPLSTVPLSTKLCLCLSVSFSLSLVCVSEGENRGWAHACHKCPRTLLLCIQKPRGARVMRRRGGEGEREREQTEVMRSKVTLQTDRVLFLCYHTLPQLFPAFYL